MAKCRRPKQYAARFTPLAAVALLAAPVAAGAPADDLTRRAQPCTACHGSEGRATADGYYPRIAGKPAGYLLNQLANFAAGRRRFPEMIYLAQLQDESGLAELAGYFASQHPPYPAPEVPRVPAAVLERGRALATQGDPASRVPACRACHGARLTGVEPAVPGLLGLSQDYLLAQLGAWLEGTRSARAPDCMAQLAHRLTSADRGAIAAWLSTQAVPADASPDRALAAPAPLRCGTIEESPTGQFVRASPATHGNELLERGRALVAVGGCEGCHSARGGKAFAGGRAIPTAFGVFYSPNITPDRQSGIGAWSAEDFWHALHEGLGRNGSPLYPAFPYTSYTRLTRSDADAIFAWLRSLPPVAQPNRPHDLRFPYQVRSLLTAWRALYFRPGVYVSDTGRTAEWNRGAYLVEGAAHCSACHDARNALGAERKESDAPGGLVLGWYAPALGLPEEAGVQGLSAPELVTLLSTGHLAAGADGASHAALGPMAEVVFDSLQYLDAGDLGAMAAYLRSLPREGAAQRSAVPAGRAPAPVLYDEGRSLYAAQCASCHGERGEGARPQGPALARNRSVLLANPVNAIRMVLYGGYPPGTHGNPRPFGMPPFYPSLSDLQVAGVLSVVRSSWGNAAGAVDPEQVAANRGDPLW